MAEGDHLKKVQSGDPLRMSARTFNALIDAAQDFQSRRQSIGGAARPDLRQPGIVKVKNNSGEARDRFDILGIEGVLFTPDDNRDEFLTAPTLVGATPAVEDHAGRFVILAEPLAAGAIGRALISGETVARVKVAQTDDEPPMDLPYRYAEIADGQAGFLQAQGAGSVRMLWVQDDSAEELPEQYDETGDVVRWAVVHIGNPVTPFYVGEVLEDIGYQQFGKVTVRYALGSSDGTPQFELGDVEACCPLLESTIDYVRTGTIVVVDCDPLTGVWAITGIDRCLGIDDEVEE